MLCIAKTALALQRILPPSGCVSCWSPEAKSPLIAEEFRTDFAEDRSIFLQKKRKAYFANSLIRVILCAEVFFRAR